MLTSHATVRCQQRGIPPLVIDWLHQFGEERFDHRGAAILHFSKRSIRRLERAVGRQPVSKMKEYLRCYAVISNGHVITAGKRYKKFKT